MSFPDFLNTLLVGLPVALLVLFVVLRKVAEKTKTTKDDTVVEVVGEILEGLEKVVPEEIDLKSSQSKEQEQPKVEEPTSKLEPPQS